MKELTYDFIKSVYQKKGYPFPEGKLKLLGIRTNNKLADTFDDYILMCWEEHGKGKMFGCMGTTDPGAHGLANPMDPNGTAVVVPGFYPGVFYLSTIGRSYKYFRQAGTFKVWRDNNKDTRLDMSGKIYNAGPERQIQLHRAHQSILMWRVGKYSYGCQVVQNEKAFGRIVTQAEIAEKAGQKLFDYGLFVEEDFS